MSEEVDNISLESIRDVFSAANIVETAIPTVVTSTSPEQERDRPLMTAPNWSEYVMKQLEPDEIINGNPSTDGLRRIVPKILGPIINSECRVVASPSINNDFGATVIHEITIHWMNDDHDLPPHERKFSEVADVSRENTKPEFFNHASGTASTRAEGRALRKALKLKHMVTAEEVAPETEDEKTNGKINENQINFIKVLCKRNKIDMIKYINSGKQKYEDVHDIDYQVAVKMIGFLSSCQREPNKIPPSVKESEAL